MTKEGKGMVLVFLTAFISGFSIFLNAFGVQGIAPSLFVGMKNLFVGLVIVSLLLLTKERAFLQTLKFSDWTKLFLVGLIGGSVPFVLFFQGLTMTSSAKAGFIHKTLFVYVALFSVVVLREKMTKKIFIGFFALLLGQALFLRFRPEALGAGDALVFLATLFWAAEIVISKKLLSRIPVNIVAGSRMLFGGALVWLYLFWTGNASGVLALTPAQVSWTVISTILLAGYVFSFYHGLKRVPAHAATAVLALGAPVTLVLSAVFQGARIHFAQAAGMFIMVLAVYFFMRAILREKKTDNYVPERSHS